MPLSLDHHAHFDAIFMFPSQDVSSDDCKFCLHDIAIEIVEFEQKVVERNCHW